MIRYTLICEHEHEFEAWFSSSTSFDEQQDAGVVECPMCGTNAVEKTLMTPSVPARRQNQNTALVPQTAESSMMAQSHAQSLAEPQTQTMANAEVVSEAHQKLAELAREVRKHVTANSENVGDNFAEEARKIHHEESERRNIYGKATRDEVESLIEDEIEVMPLPELPEDKN